MWGLDYNVPGYIARFMVKIRPAVRHWFGLLSWFDEDILPGDMMTYHRDLQT